jgi:ABC-type transporter Mla subunit MlaD
MRRASGNIAANPVLIGAVTTLVVIVAVFLAYNANNGLPFVPTRQLNVVVPNGANLVPGNEVREGGYRIGVVEEMLPTRTAGGKVGAELKLKLDQTAGAVPADSSVIIRPKSSLGLKYVELTRGRSRRNIPDGGTLRVGARSIPVELDDVYSMFDAETRAGARRNLRGFGNAFVGRGSDLNRLVAELPETFGVLAPVMRNLASPRTRLDRFFAELADAARIVAPVSEVQARLFTAMAETFAAISEDEQALKDTIAKSPPTMDTAIRSFRVQRPFLADTAAFSEDLDAAATDLRAALPTVNDALEVGTPVTRRSVALSDELEGTMVALRDLAAAPATNGALRGLTATVTTLQPQLRYLGPFVTVCNYCNMFWTFAAEHLSSPDATGTTQRTLLNTGDRQDDNLSSSMGANEFANGRNVQPEGIRQFLHGNYYGAAVNDEGKASCEIGQQGYAYSANKYDDTPDKWYRRTVVEDHNGRPPTDEPIGPTFKRFDKDGKGSGLNRLEVPPGQTFTRRPGGRGALTDNDREELGR